MANQFLALSLFLMLLSFFIVMNAVSGFEQTKVQPALQSLSLAFSNSPLAQDQAPTDTPTPRMSLGDGDTFENLEGLFNAHISHFQLSKNRLGTEMYVRLPVADFEKSIDIPYIRGDSPANAAGRGSFLPTLVTLLRSEKNNLPYRMDMVLTVPGGTASYQINDPEGFKSAMRLAATLAQKMENNGLPAPLLSAGLKQGDAGYVDLTFKRHEPYSPLDSNTSPERNL